MLNCIIPVVETERLILRPITIDDAESMFEYASDFETTKLLTFPIHKTIEDSIYAIETFFLPRAAKGIPEAYALVLKETNQMIGTCDIHSIIGVDTGEVGYVLNKNYWGRGLITEALKKLIEVSFINIGIRRLQIRHHIDNIGSQRVCEKTDFRLEGTLRQQMKEKDNSYGDYKIYSILSNEFEKGELKWQKN